MTFTKRISIRILMVLAALGPAGVMLADRLGHIFGLCMGAH